MDEKVEDMVPIDEEEYKEIVSKLEDSYLAGKLEKNEEWKLVLKAAKHLRDITQEQYNHLDHTDKDGTYKAIQCQVVIQFYDDFLKSLIERYKSIGEEAFRHAKDMGWINRMSLWITNQF